MLCQKEDELKLKPVPRYINILRHKGKPTTPEEIRILFSLIDSGMWEHYKYSR